MFFQDKTLVHAKKKKKIPPKSQPDLLFGPNLLFTPDLLFAPPPVRKTWLFPELSLWWSGLVFDQKTGYPVPSTGADGGFQDGSSLWHYVIGKVGYQLAPQAHGTLLLLFRRILFSHSSLGSTSSARQMVGCKMRIYANCPTFILYFSFRSQVLTIFCTQNLKMACKNWDMHLRSKILISERKVTPSQHAQAPVHRNQKNIFLIFWG